MLALFRKDLLLMKKQVYIMTLFQIILTPVLIKQLGDSGIIGGYLIYFLMLFISVLVLQNTISIAEATDQRAIAYLCALPYKRGTIVAEKYALDMLLILEYTIIYNLEAKIFAYVPKLDAWAGLMCVLGVILYRGIYIPLEYKLGYEKTKFVTTIFALLVPFGLTTVLSKVTVSNGMIDFLEGLSDLAMTGVVSIAIVVIIIISSIISSRIFNNKDL